MTKRKVELIILWCWGPWDGIIGAHNTRVMRFAKHNLMIKLFAWRVDEGWQKNKGEYFEEMACGDWPNSIYQRERWCQQRLLCWHAAGRFLRSNQIGFQWWCQGGGAFNEHRTKDQLSGSMKSKDLLSVIFHSLLHARGSPTEKMKGHIAGTNY